MQCELASEKQISSSFRISPIQEVETKTINHRIFVECNKKITFDLEKRISIHVAKKTIVNSTQISPTLLGSVEEQAKCAFDIWIVGNLQTDGPREIDLSISESVPICFILADGRNQNFNRMAQNVIIHPNTEATKSGKLCLHFILFISRVNRT